MNFIEAYIRKKVNIIFINLSGKIFNNFAPQIPPIIPPIAQKNDIFQSI